MWCMTVLVCGLRVPWIELRGRPAPCEVQARPEWRASLQNEKFGVPQLHTLQVTININVICTYNLR